MKSTNKSLLVAALTTALTLSSAIAQPSTVDPTLAKKVRHELVMMPFSVFDTLSYRIDNGVVTLMGEVTKPTLKTDAGRLVARVEGVAGVVNNIEVLPLSPFDDRIRMATYRAIYGYGPLRRYAMGTQPGIRIIVRNGNVSLEGVVANKMDSQLANMRANQVPGVFSVNNDLQIGSWPFSSQAVSISASRSRFAWPE